MIDKTLIGLKILEVEIFLGFNFTEYQFKLSDGRTLRFTDYDNNAVVEPQ